MRYLLARLVISVLVAALFFAGTANKTMAQTYPIDCAILLCLSGGWPASVPCARARTEFIRRITPWPIEPPLQIWRCPMGASYYPDRDQLSGPRILEVLLKGTSSLPQSFSDASLQEWNTPILAVAHINDTQTSPLLNDPALRLIQDRADIDIRGPEFNFVRSIRVFDVRYARQRESGPDDDCNRSARVVLGTYGTQGDFAWRASSPTALPDAHVGLERYGQNCPSIYHRSVFVDWRDFEGNYGFEQVNY